MHLKNIYIIIGISLAFIQCTEIYTPDISSDTKALIVEGLITDEEGPYTIKLTMAKPLPFDSVRSEQFFVHDAKCTITDNEKNTITLTETSSGNYTTPLSFRAKVGNIYKLSILLKDGTRYESLPEKLLAPNLYNSIRAFYNTEDFINSKNELQKVQGADIRVDLFNNYPTHDTVPSSRLASNLTIQYFYTYREKNLAGFEIKDWRWDNFGWKTYKLNSFENITEAKNPSSSPLLKNHFLGFMPYYYWSYGLDIPDPQMIYYIRINQYTMNRDSYRFYKGANEQLSATGAIFDPIASQLYSNMKCVSNPTKIVLGLFEVSSVKKQAVVIDMLTWKLKIRIFNVPYVDIPKDKEYHYKVWESAKEMPNDTLFDFIPVPDWWNHNL